MEFGGGIVTVAECTQSEFDECVRNLRETDRDEFFFGGCPDPIGAYEMCYSIRIRGELVGFCGIAVPKESTPDVNVRFLCYFSTFAVDRNRISFVRYSRQVMRWIASHAPEHVIAFVSMPMSRYRQSIIWHKRVLGMKIVDMSIEDGEEFTVFGIDRKSLMEEV